MKSIVTTTKLNSFHNFIFVSVYDFLFFSYYSSSTIRIIAVCVFGMINRVEHAWRVWPPANDDYSSSSLSNLVHVLVSDGQC